MIGRWLREARLWAVVALAVLAVVLPSATAGAAVHAYDMPTVVRVDVHRHHTDETRAGHLSDVPWPPSPHERSASPPARTRLLTPGPGLRTATNSAGGLGARANEIHGALDPIAQNSRTTAVMSTREGPNVIASGGRDLSPAQRALTGPEDVLGKLPGAHAEVTAMDAAAKAGLTPAEIAASRPICPACEAAITESGGQVSPSGWWAWWPG
jgi:hypothetical protein